MKQDYVDVDGTRMTVHSIDGWTPEARTRVDAYSLHRMAYMRHDLGYPFGFVGVWVQIFDGMLPVLTSRGYFLVGPQGQLLFVERMLMGTRLYKPSDCLAEESKAELRDVALAVLGNIPPFEFVRQTYSHIDYDAPQVKQNAAKSMRLHAVPPRSALRIWLTDWYRRVFVRSA